MKRYHFEVTAMCGDYMPNPFPQGKHCFSYPHCGYKDYFQSGGGWTPRSYVYCKLIGAEVYVEPPDADGVMKPIEKVLLPDKCPYAMMKDLF
ncbi:hypothetical protein [Thermosinus carboxydivorans]|uniref:hypothetical protein n=1 Tax=Thermosinus carboxydivorans TaxID=261685 RepID=UPI0012E9C57B|nr:hypothetical protein [Thermosinus carboxydivorans]